MITLECGCKFHDPLSPMSVGKGVGTFCPLHAAAPELLEELVHCVLVLAARGGPLKAERTEAIRRADAVIAKARTA